MGQHGGASFRFQGYPTDPCLSGLAVNCGIAESDILSEAGGGLWGGGGCWVLGSHGATEPCRPFRWEGRRIGNGHGDGAVALPTRETPRRRTSAVPQSSGDIPSSCVSTNFIAVHSLKCFCSTWWYGPTGTHARGG